MGERVSSYDGTSVSLDRRPAIGSRRKTSFHPRDRFRRQHTTVAFDDRATNRQPDTRALRLGGYKGLKQPLSHFRSEAGIGVDDADDDLIGACRQFGFDSKFRAAGTGPSPQ
jgi:hypothetical protein